MKWNWFHPFHMVTCSPWPLLVSLNLLGGVLAVILFFNNWLFYLSFSSLSLAYIMMLWWRDVIRESTYQGAHTKEVVAGLQLGMILFILSEVMFFFSFFFSWFFVMLNPDPSVGGLGLPSGVEPLNFMKVPLFNTILLLSSGVSVTWSHHCLIHGLSATNPLKITLFLGFTFLIFQLVEYHESYFTMSDSVYGSLFYISTGFHGIHVFMGSLFLGVSLFRMNRNHFSPTHHIGYEASIWYWHFVDVVWLFLFVSIYWWGS
nr:cytochrome c oxidase subunit 3 [Linognathus africanus]